MTKKNYTKWVACWGNATSITDRQAANYAKDITLRYPIRVCFSGDKVRLRLSNLTGTEPVRLSQVFVALQRPDAYEPVAVGFEGQEGCTLPPGTETESDAIRLNVQAGDTIDVSIYLGEVTQMNAGTLITGPLSKGQFAYGNHTQTPTLPANLSRSTNWFYFLNTVDIHTEEENHAIVCYGDSITAQSWPDYFALRNEEEGRTHVSVIRRAVCGSRILRQYDCIAYQAYGLKGATRFPIELNTAGASAVIIQHGINDIIHPVGIETNPFRPWSDLPTCEELIQGTTEIYLRHARDLGLKVYSGTLLPICGWRTYNPQRDVLRNAYNQWLRTSPLFDACIDFDKALRNEEAPNSFLPHFDSGDHLHPSEAGYKAMAWCIPSSLL